jgi:hypothetical protein
MARIAAAGCANEKLKTDNRQLKMTDSCVPPLSVFPPKADQFPIFNCA